MEHLENYIYVIIIIGSLIVSFIQKKRQKQDEKDKGKTLSQPTPRKTFEEIFGEIFEGTTKEKKSVVRPQTAIAVEPQPISKQKEYNPPTMLDNFATAKNTHIRHIEIPEDNTTRRFDVRLEDATDWQKAFVYSEIFNRKY